ncbi:1-(5-phosphoribosyl)-5-amino-4-imidazole-carboxylate carboxylase [Geothermobacter hydrogeniphilus]|uniref:1-(5-phosphoribosyl)-5-amino-4-imidazole-carboxylate carboxylase n=1 Tax=Geothermobacter hydrogeniphilus TaxID=1969733 RepID=A0A2K2H6Q6_9BACT|nr:nickel pincer cofactor biosynthesis protein LarB [Geothermobacter hydrogeniphilus]PNU18988.1 1-(5-phosphoribosyl)-5-amino-4-imidazole-carboxylate carboxylase [Geothermobacter hydrogeniphilus]
MNQRELKNLLAEIRDGRIDLDEGLARLRHLPFEDIGIARIDHHRELRQGAPEVIFGENKTPEQLLAIVSAMTGRQRNILVTRLDEEKGGLLASRWTEGDYDPLARTFCLQLSPLPDLHRGPLLIACAGTSDLPVAREAMVTARMFGIQVEELTDVGVAGIHRLLAETDPLSRAAAIIVVAGMEGALPSVVGGLVAVPVIAVPTSVGYGAAFGGVAALLGMLNSCAGGVTVVNIDNGFGAAFAAARILRRQPA